MKIRGREIRLPQLFALFVYYSFLRHLPSGSSLFFGKFFRFLRYQCCRHIFLECGSNVNVERGAYFASGSRLKIGDNSGLGIDCHVPGDIVIGRNVMMGPNCHIFGANHAFDRVDVPIIEQGFEAPKKTTIEDDVWIGRNVCFTPGRYVKRGSVIGAGCLLSKDYPEYSIIGGNPSRLIRSRIKARPDTSA
jgi:maltose O-acetyltransferase